MKKLLALFCIIASCAFAQAADISIGKGATLAATADGTAPFTYQWSKNSAPISGATGASLDLGAVGLTASGTYSVVITNQWGNATASIVVNVKGLPPSNPKISLIERVVAWLKSLFNRNA